MSNKVFARDLCHIDDLKSRGKLSFLRNKNLIGTDIDIQFRGDYLNLYYKGASLLKFKWLSHNSYEITISGKYLKPVEITWLKPRNTLDDNSIQPVRKNFKAIVAQLKSNIRYLEKGNENAFEQIFRYKTFYLTSLNTISYKTNLDLIDEFGIIRQCRIPLDPTS